MIRSQSLLALIIALSYLRCAHMVTGTPPTTGARDDTAEIYGTFLSHWSDSGKAQVNISRTAETPSFDDVRRFSECAQAVSGLGAEWVPSKPIEDLGGAIGTLPYIHLVDPKAWKLQDSADLIAEHKSVESAVQEGFAHGLLTLSAISFDESHEVAAFSYSFVCGGLCGNGSVVLFRKVNGRWVQSDCGGGWMS